jgi:electron transport complex protein RnfB
MAVATACALLLLAAALSWRAGPALWQRLSGPHTPPGARLGRAILTFALLALALFGLAQESADHPPPVLALPVGAALGLLLSWLSATVRKQSAGSDRDALAERIESLLPQTQCTQCGFAGCKPYAQAIARDEADIDQCPPGGEAGVRALAELLGRAPKPVNPAHGVEKPVLVALVREAECIGCTKCIQACPVDAIVGASKLMHTVIADLCTGCELCLPPCPVDCIDLVPATAAAPGIPAPSTG